MTSSRVLIALLVAATVLVDLVVMCLGGPPRPDTPPLQTVVVLALIYSQVNLLAVWAGLARPVSPWRWTCLIGFVVLCGLFSATDADANVNECTTNVTVGLLILEGFVVGSLWIARFAGVTLVDGAGDTTDQDAAANRKAKQFSLGQMFGWMIGLAVCLGLLRCTIHGEHLLREIGVCLSWGIVAFLSNAAIVLLVLWVTLGKRWPVLRGLTLCLAILVAIMFVWMLVPTTIVRTFLALFTLYVLLMLGSLWVVRMAGYRLTLRKKTSARSGAEIGDERDATEAPDGDAVETSDEDATEAPEGR